MKALTLWRPWPVAIFYLKPEIRKDVENRQHKIWKSVIGNRVAIHAGVKFDKYAFGFWLDVIQPDPSQALSLLTEWDPLSKVAGIIGTVIFGESMLLSECTSRWAEGPKCWPIFDPIPLDKPIPCKGAQGFWDVPSDIEKKIKAQHGLADE